MNPNALAHYGIGLEDVTLRFGRQTPISRRGIWKIHPTDGSCYDSDQLLKPGAVCTIDRSLPEWGSGAAERHRESDRGNRRPPQFGIFERQTRRSDGIGRQPGANIIETVDKIMALIPELSASIPPSVTLDHQLQSHHDDSRVRERHRIHAAADGCARGDGDFLFLRNAWATIIPSIAVPLSIVGTFGVMYLLQYNLDNLSLMALAICTGFVVDDAIVVIENITRYLEEGDSPLAAAMKGSREIGFTVLSMSISLIAVFIPLLLMGGIIGRLFREFAITLSVAIVVSLCVSLTTTPMMCALFLKSERDVKHGKVLPGDANGYFNGVLQTTLAGCAGFCATNPSCSSLRARPFALACICISSFPRDFFPQQDTGLMAGNILASQDTSFPVMQEKLKEYTDIVMGDPAVKSTVGKHRGRSGKYWAHGDRIEADRANEKSP